MTPCKTVIENIIGTLKSSELSDIDLVSEFPSKRRDIPLRRATVSVGVEKVKVTPAEDASVIAAGASPETIRVKLMICVPRDFSGINCYDILDRIVLRLGLVVSSCSVTAIETGEMKYSSALNGLCLPLTVTIAAGNAY